jgi:hypothetical protein
MIIISLYINQYSLLYHVNVVITICVYTNCCMCVYHTWLLTIIMNVSGKLEMLLTKTHWDTCANNLPLYNLERTVHIGWVHYIQTEFISSSMSSNSWENVLMKLLMWNNLWYQQLIYWNITFYHKTNSACVHTQNHSIGNTWL